MKKITLSLLAVFGLMFNVSAQDGPEGMLFADSEDTNRLINAYMNPAMKGLVYGMSNGWYHTAKVHKKFGFDITIGVSGATAPSKEEMFSLSNLKSINQATGGGITSATVVGSENDGSNATVTFQENGITYTGTFEMPGGVKESLPLDFVPAPAIQASLGLPFKSEVILRFVPKVGEDDVKGSLFGIGLKKEITSWFGPLDKLPLHVSILAAYTTMGVDYDIKDENTSDNIAIENGKIDFDLNSYTVQAIASLNFPIINVYGGVGYTGGSSSVDMLGKYTLSYNASLNQRVLNNPLNLDSNTGAFNATIGTRLSLGFFKIFGSYTMQEYNSVNAGIAFSFR